MGKVIVGKGGQLGDSGAEASRDGLYRVRRCIVIAERAAQSGKLLCARSVICFFQVRVSPSVE